MLKKRLTVNGFLNENGVTINLNSAKALNSVAGHEITHVLEGTEFYDTLKTAVEAYAKSKGEYDSRLEQLTKLYEGRHANVEQELVADLVGDYLFTDSDFIRNLSTEHRGVFEKLFDEIKYLCKVAKAGSKEARQLEKVKKAFEDAYRTETKNPTGDGGVRYSLGDINYPRKMVDFSDTKGRRAAEDETVNVLVQRGKVTTIAKDSIPEELSNVNWGDKAESRAAIKGILKEFLGEDVVFNLGENSAIAYLTSKGLDHTLAGDNTAEKAAALSAFYGLIGNAEYSYSGHQDQHSKTVGREDWDYFVSVAEIEGSGIVPLVFAVRSIDQDVRSQIYSIATKKNPAIPRGDGTQGKPANAHPSYGDSSSSNGIVEQNDPNVKQQFSLSGNEQTSTPVRGGIYAKDVLLEGLDAISENTVANQDIADSELVAGLDAIAEDTGAKSEYAELFPSEEDLMETELRAMDDAYRVQTNEEGNSSSLYDSGEGGGVDTVARRLEVKRQNAQWELEASQKSRQETMAAYDEKIASLQAKYDAKPNKHTKAAEKLSRQIQRMQRMKADRLVGTVVCLVLIVEIV